MLQLCRTTNCFVSLTHCIVFSGTKETRLHEEKNFWFAPAHSLLVEMQIGVTILEISMEKPKTNKQKQTQQQKLNISNGPDLLLFGICPKNLISYYTSVSQQHLWNMIQHSPAVKKNKIMRTEGFFGGPRKHYVE